MTTKMTNVAIARGRRTLRGMMRVTVDMSFVRLRGRGETVLAICFEVSGGGWVTEYPRARENTRHARSVKSWAARPSYR